MLEAAPGISMDALTMLGRAVLAAVFLMGGVAKLADRPGTRRSFVDFGFPSWLAPPLSIGLPIAELILAATLLPTGSARAGAAAALLLLAAFSMTIAIAITRGYQVECRCFGQLTSGLIGWRTLARNVVLAAIALVVLLAGHGTPPPSLLDPLLRLRGAELVAWTIGITAVALIVLGVWGFVHLLRAHGLLLLRVEALEQRRVRPGFRDWLEASKEYAVGLPPGVRVPSMTAETVEGFPVNWRDLLGRSDSVLLLFTSPQCTACRDLPPEIRAWQQRLAGRVRLVLASNGTAEEVRSEAADFGLTDALVDRDLRLFHAFEAKGTPSAVLVRKDETVGSHMASGQAAILELLTDLAAQSENGSRFVAPAALPPLSLRQLQGGRITMAELIREPTVVLFWNPGCGYCRSMRDDLRRWERRQLPRAPRLVVVSSGDEANVRAEGFEAPVLLDPEFAVGRALGIGGTPVAVLVDAEHHIVSSPATGPEAVLALANTSAEASRKLPFIGGPR
jgi:thiol-disulfide isomerase/thioredoxin